MTTRNAGDTYKFDLPSERMSECARCGHDADYHEEGSCSADFRAFFGARCDCGAWVGSDFGSGA